MHQGVIRQKESGSRAVQTYFPHAGGVLLVAPRVVQFINPGWRGTGAW
jgi:hypothetical protein